MQVARMAETMALQWEGDMEHPHIREGWGFMAAHMELGAHMELAAMAAACMGDQWDPPWGRTGATALAWAAATDPAAMGAACMGGLMAATTAMALALEVVTWGRLMERAPCQVNLVGPSWARNPPFGGTVDQITCMCLVWQHDPLKLQASSYADNKHGKFASMSVEPSHICDIEVSRSYQQAHHNGPKCSWFRWSCIDKLT